MDLTVYLFLALVFLLGGIAIKLFLFPGRQKKQQHAAEIRALNYILEGKKEKALQILKDIARENTANIGAFLQVGDLYRQLGNGEAAVRVHQEVLDRDGLDSDTVRMVHEKLAMDYESLGNFTQAAQHASAMLKIERKNLWALKALHRYAVQQKDWNGAIKAFQKETAAGGVADAQLPAIYKTQEALQLKGNGDTDGAVSALKQAIKLNKSCAAPYYHLGKIKQGEGNFRHAIDFLSSFVELDAQLGSTVFADIEKMYFELGEFEQVENFYKRLRQKMPKNLDVVIGLANYYERKGEGRDALALLEEQKHTGSENLNFILTQMNLLQKLGYKDELKSVLDEHVTQDRQRRVLGCSQCGQVYTEPFYLCDKCGAIRHG